MKKMQRMQRKNNILKCLLLACALLFGVLTASAGPVQGQAQNAIAAEADKASQKASLTLDNVISGSVFRLYQVQVKDSSGAFVTTEDFAKYSVDYNAETSEEMRALCNTLASYVRGENAPAAYTSKEVSSDGTVTFTGLVPGLYLAMGDAAEVNGNRLEQAPVLAFLPYTEKDGTQTYDAKVTVKQEPLEDTTSYSVYKVWSDGKSASRPKSIKVQLKADGKALGEAVTLSSENNWKYTWSDLEKGHKYSVTEVSVPSGYTVSITEESGVFTIRNTSTPPKTPPSTPPKTPGGKLPQTGQLWWPVPILVVMGLIFFAAGIIKKRNFSEEKSSGE